jgi:hypothetical protein
MRIIIKQIFGESKEKEKVTKEDIRKLINKWKIEESASLEYKSTERLRIENGKLVDKNKPEEDKKEELLIKPLVAFLNKYQPEGGLLIWGIYTENGIPTKLQAFHRGIIKKEDIERWISINISSVPLAKEPPFIEIEEIEINERSVFLIEVHPRDFNTVYFSKITNKVYIRRGRRSEELFLPEIYKLIEEKIIAKVFIVPHLKRFETLENRKIRAEIKFSYKNEGYRPGEWVKSMINFKIIGSKTVLKMDTQNTMDFISRNETPYIWNTETLCPKEGFLFQINSYFREIIYPFAFHTIGSLTLEYKINAKLKIEIVTNEYRGSTRQIFYLLPNGDILEKLKIFTPYI